MHDEQSPQTNFTHMSKVLKTAKFFEVVAKGR